MKQPNVQYKYTFGTPKNNKTWMTNLNESLGIIDNRSNQNKPIFHCGHLGCSFESITKTEVLHHIQKHLMNNKHVKCYRCKSQFKNFPKAILRHTLHCHSRNKMSLGFILN